jgi:acyl dehydratase
MKNIDELFQREQALVGREMGPTRWRDVTQTSITEFGHCTEDPDPMHIDPEWAAVHSPFGQTIAFGFWTLSMMSNMLQEAYASVSDAALPDALMAVNYGCERLRFIQPVPVGARIRLRATPFSVESPQPDRLLRRVDVTIEIENVDRPALVARWMSLSILPGEEAVLEGFRRRGEN